MLLVLGLLFSLLCEECILVFLFVVRLLFFVLLCLLLLVLVVLLPLLRMLGLVQVDLDYHLICCELFLSLCLGEHIISYDRYLLKISVIIFYSTWGIIDPTTYYNFYIVIIINNF